MHLGKIDDTQGILRYKGYLRALAEAGLEAAEDYLLCVTNDIMPLYDFFENNSSNILNKLNKVTAVFCYNDQIADAFVNFIISHGVRIPDDISIMGYDDSLFATQHCLTCVAHPKELLGKTAAEHMLRLLEEPSFDPAHIFEPYLIIRDSVRDIH